jgi:hypothetical protein
MPKQELLQFAMVVVVHLRLLSKEYKKKKKIIDVWNLIYNTTSV